LPQPLHWRVRRREQGARSATSGADAASERVDRPDYPDRSLIADTGARVRLIRWERNGLDVAQPEMSTLRL
jgi:hypothetical protein